MGVRAEGVLLGALMLLGCEQLTPADEAKVFTLMECEECVSGEMDSVVAIGRRIVPLLVGLLRDGPPGERHNLARQHLTSAWHRAREYGLVHGYADSVPSESLYVQTYLDNYVATYQARSAKALGRLGGAEAREALLRSLIAPMRPGVVAEVQYALDSLWHP
jgi:hypothetical protein